MEPEVGQAAPVLAYAGAERLRRPEWHDDGRRYLLLLPARPLWMIVTWRTVALVFWLALGGAGAVGVLVMIDQRRGASDSGDLLCLAVATLGFACAAYTLFDLVRVSRSQRLPTTIRIPADGVSVETSRTSKTQRYHFAVALIRRAAAEMLEPMRGQEFQVCLRVLLASRESMSFLFTLRGRESIDALNLALKHYLPPHADTGDGWIDAMNADVRLD